MRRIATLLVLLAGLVGTSVLLAGPAEAHATVVSSTPGDGTRAKQAPKYVSVVFDEPVGLGSTGYMHVTDQTGRRVDTGSPEHPNGDGSKARVSLKNDIGKGTYTLSFRVVSADSHPVAGTIRFVVGNGALARGSVGATGGNPITERLFDVMRWVSYLGLALLGGAWIVLTVWPEGRDDRRARRIIWSGWGLAVFGAVAELLMQGPYTAGTNPLKLFSTSFVDATLHTDYGQLHSLRIVLLGLLALVFARSLQADARPMPWEGVSALIGIGVAATFSVSGHAGTTKPGAISVPLDMLHLLAMSAWVGGLIMLLVAVLPRHEPDELRDVLPVFSRVAFTSVVVLAVTGTYAAWRGIGALDAVVGTTYGLIVLAKILLFVGMLAIANVSRQVVQRRVRIAYALTDDAEVDDDTSDVDEAQPTERLRRAVLVEVSGAILILALTSFLVAEPRGREALAAQYREPVSSSVTLAAGRTATVSVDPGTHGQVTLTIDFAGGLPNEVGARVTQIDKRIGPTPVKLSKAGRATWSGSAPMTVAGRWRVDLVVTTSEFDAVTADTTLTLH